MHPALTSSSDPAGRYIDWGVIHISATNVAIIIAMLILFALALLVPFPHGQGGSESPTRVDARPPTPGEDEEGRP